MHKDTLTAPRVVVFILGVLFAAVTAGASSPPEKGVLEIGRFSLSLSGGYAVSPGSPGMLDIKTELQYELSSRIRIGLGVGYMAGVGIPGSMRDRRHLSDPFLAPDQNSDPYVRLFPLSLNVYYLLPLGPHWSVFASGGGSYYLADLQGLAGPARQGLLGGQGGLGVEYHLTHGLSLFAEGNYRLLDVRGLSKLRVGDGPPGDGVWDPAGFLTSGSRSSGLNLRGLSFRIGIRINL